MNQATREYLDAVRRAHSTADEAVAEANGERCVYYPTVAGVLKARLAAEIERRTGEAVDHSAERQGSVEKAA